MIIEGGSFMDAENIEEENAEFIPDEISNKEDLKQTIRAMINEERSVSNDSSLTSTTTSAAYVAANAATPVTEESVKAGAKAMGKFTTKKIIIGITAAIVVAGGIGAAVLLKFAADPMIWSGYGAENELITKRFEMTIDEMNDTDIRGQLEVSYLYDVKGEIPFSGTGVKKDDDVIYTLKLEEPLRVGTTLVHKYYQLEITYDNSEDEFSFNQYYDVELKRHTNEKPKVLFKNETWSGIGKDGFYKANKTNNHQFEFKVRKMTEEDISGRLTVSYDGKVDHDSKFTGRGYEKDGTIYYEILLKKPRTQESALGEITLGRFWLEYDSEKQTFTIPFGTNYRVVANKN